MTEQPEQIPNIYALLIGIDYYLPNRLYKSLKGAVRDINLVADYLLKTLKIPSERIFKLTSPNPETLDAVPTSESSEVKDAPPTYENIVAAFQKIAEEAPKDAQVYIHYSGHGGRAVTVYPEIKGEGQHDEGIVPMDVGEQGGRYLRDIELATLLKRMTDKELVVTVILDSCHSGGATRGDCEIRGAKDGEVDLTEGPEDSLVASREELIRNWKTLIGADEGFAGGWLPQSNDYVLLAACRPSEYAFEYAVNGKERHGALTYWMIDTLTTIPSELSYKSLHARINAKIQSKFPSQLPMLMGSGDRQVFANVRLSTPYTATVIKVNANQKEVTLNAGLAQGLSSGTQFAIYPLNTKNFTDKQQRVAIIELTEVEASSSYAKVLTPEQGGIELKDGSKLEEFQGAPAVMVSAPPNLIRRVRLFDQKETGNKENELPPELVGKQKEALQAVRQALEGNGLLIEVQADDQQEADYQVAVGRGGEYEICIGMPIENLRPPLMVNDLEAAKGVVNRLVHLAKYQTVQAIDNPDSELVNSLDFELLDQNKEPFPDSSNLELKEREVAYLRIKNNSREVLNVAVLDLEPTWAISQIPVLNQDETFYALNPDEERSIRLRFVLPEVEGYEQAREILKLFATRGPANFQWLTLTPLDEQPERKAGMRSINSPFGQLLEAMGADVDAPPPRLTRAALRDPDPNQEWMTKRIQMTIKR